MRPGTVPEELQVSNSVDYFFVNLSIHYAS